MKKIPVYKIPFIPLDTNSYRLHEHIDSYLLIKNGRVTFFSEAYSFTVNSDTGLFNDEASYFYYCHTAMLSKIYSYNITFNQKYEYWEVTLFVDGCSDDMYVEFETKEPALKLINILDKIFN